MVYVLLVPGYEEIEAIAPVDILRRAGCEVTTVGVFDRQVVGAHGVRIEADTTWIGLKRSELEALVLPGGPGHTEYRKKEELARLLGDCFVEGIPIAAICAAPSYLGELGLLEGRRYTCYPGYESERFGGEYTGAVTELARRVLTARGPGAAMEFGLALAALLKGDETAEKVRASMRMP